MEFSGSVEKEGGRTELSEGSVPPTSETSAYHLGSVALSSSPSKGTENSSRGRTPGTLEGPELLPALSPYHHLCPHPLLGWALPPCPSVSENAEKLECLYTVNANVKWCLLLLFVMKSCPTLCDPMDSSTPCSSILHYLPEFAQIHVH